MEILQLEHFIAVVEEGSFTRAAERVSRTQPAVSQSIRRLEDEVDAPLFVRGSHTIALTPAGQTLLQFARRMLDLRSEAKHALGDLKGLNTGSVSVSAHESAALYLLPSPIRSFLDRFPAVKVGIYRHRVEDIPARVADREIDIGFVTKEPAIRDLRVSQVHVDSIILVASPEHPLAQSRQPVTVRALGAERFITHHLCVSVAAQIRKVFEDHETPYRVSVELCSFEAVKDFVRQNVGLAMLPRLSVLPQLQDGSLVHVPVQGFDIQRRTLAVFRDRRYMSDASRELLTTIRRFDWTQHLVPTYIGPRLARLA
jgi:DNA-binding transcriptional LysR family regulator